MVVSSPFWKHHARREGYVERAPVEGVEGVGGVPIARRFRTRARSGMSAVVDRLVDLAPRIPVRDLAALRAQFPGLGPEEIADRLVRAATAGTAAVGAGVGAAAMLPVPPAMTTELVTEMLGVAAVEFKLIAELHEVYGVRAPGNVRQRAAAYLAAWTERRGIEITRPSSIDSAFSRQMKREISRRLARRTAHNLPTLTPLMIGAAVGAVLNRRDTQSLADRVREDLRGRQVPWEAPDAPELPPSGP